MVILEQISSGQSETLLSKSPPDSAHFLKTLDRHKKRCQLAPMGATLETPVLGPYCLQLGWIITFNNICEI